MPPNRRHNATMACTSCRQRRRRCDGVKPACAGCQARQLECVWSDAADGRSQHVSRGEYDRLIDQVGRLRQLLSSHGISPPESPTRTNARPVPYQDQLRHADILSHNASDDLQLDLASGRVFFRGPTGVPSLASAPGSSRQHQYGSIWLPHPLLDELEDDFRPDAAEHSHLLSTFFTHLNHHLAFIDEPAFMTEMHVASSDGPTDPRSHSQHYSPFLHLAILSQASQLCHPMRSSSNSQNHTESHAWTFLAKALQELGKELEHPTPATVIGLSLVMTSLADVGKLFYVWLYAGLSVRLAQDLGLHINAQALVEQGTISRNQLRARENAFWVVYWHDKLLSLQLGRAPSLTDADHDLPLPTDDPLRLAQLSLGHLFTKLVTTLYGLRMRRTRTPTQIENVQKEVLSWHTTLPTQLQLRPESGHLTATIILLHLLQNLGIIFAHRPFVAVLNPDPVPGQRCLEAALSSASLAVRFDQQHNILLSPIFINQCLYAAAAALIALPAGITVDCPSGLPGLNKEREAALDSLFSLLGKLAMTRHTAAQAHEVLVALQAEQTEQAATQAAEVPDGAGGYGWWPEEWGMFDQASGLGLDLRDGWEEQQWDGTI